MQQSDRSLLDRVKTVYSTAIQRQDSALNLQAYNSPAYKFEPSLAIQAWGRIAADIAGDGTRHLFWRWNHPLAITADVGRAIGKKQGLSKPQAALVALGLTQGMELMSGNLNLNNLQQGGRASGYSAVLPSEEDSTQTTNLPLEVASRYVLGRTGRLLPWEEFRQERTDVSKEAYQKYKDYMRGDTLNLLGLENVPTPVGAAIGAVLPNLLGKRSLAKSIYGAIAGTALTGGGAEFLADQGILKGTWEGIDGPEVRMLGYRMPLGAIAGTAALGYGISKGLGYMRRRKLEGGKIAGAQWSPDVSGGGIGK